MRHKSISILLLFTTVRSRGLPPLVYLGPNFVSMPNNSTIYLLYLLLISGIWDSICNVVRSMLDKLFAIDSLEVPDNSVVSDLKVVLLVEVVVVVTDWDGLVKDDDDNDDEVGDSSSCDKSFLSFSTVEDSSSLLCRFIAILVWGIT